MSDHARSAAAAMRYECAEHLTCAQFDASQPRTMQYGDFPGNMGQLLGDALQRLERLLYAVYGARPKGYGPYVDWTMRTHPRCLWGSEQAWPESCDNDNCSDLVLARKETAALGETYAGNIPVPSVPIRSRNGDWRLAAWHSSDYAHDRTVFPVGSVERDNGSQLTYGGEPTFDPVAHAWFGGDPDYIGVSGHENDVEVAGEAIDVRWTSPEALRDYVTSAILHYGTSTDTMTETAPGSGIYEGTMPVQNQGVTKYWYVEVEITPESGPAYARFDPGGEAEPMTDQQKYPCMWFAHWNPYPHGLPELWDACAKGTDRYQFDGTESIQVELINLVRFTLDYLGNHFHHSPHYRADHWDAASCCFDAPIRWRWSGSNTWPLLRKGGKDDTQLTDPAPVHNLDDPELANQAARMSWRGTEQIYTTLYANYWYGPGASWLAPPETVPLQNEPTTGLCQVLWDGHERGLHPADVIERSHLQELIEAIQYLVDYGIWTKAPIKRRKLTPDAPDIILRSHSGTDYGCGYTWDSDIGGNPIFTEAKRCSDEFGTYGNPGDPWPEPTDWQDCWDNEPHGICEIFEQEERICFWSNQSSSWVLTVSTLWRRWCGGWMDECHGGGVMEWPASIEIDGCGAIQTDNCYGDVSGGGYQLGDAVCRTSSCGWAAWLCGPEQCPDGSDANHGNGLLKIRTVECPGPGTTIGNGWSAGNCFGEAYSCAVWLDADPADDDHSVPFEAVSRVYFEGEARDAWLYWNCDLTCGAQPIEDGCFDDADFPDPDLTPGHRDYEGDYLCSWGCWPDPATHPAYPAGAPSPRCAQGNISSVDSDRAGGCYCQLGDCMGDNIWVAVNLNLDGTNAPYATHPIYQGDPPDPASKFPLLKDYVHAPGNSYKWPDSNGELITDCPCDTWTSEWGAQGQHSGDGDCVDALT